MKECCKEYVTQVLKAELQEWEMLRVLNPSACFMAEGALRSLALRLGVVL